VRVVLYCQPLTGLGHHVRSLAIARELATAHEVHFATGGREFPGSRDAPGVRFLDLPTLWREGGRLVGGDLGERRRILRDTVSRIAPDVLLVEHFPFGKWELADETREAIEAARGAKVVCSLRDIALRSRYDTSELDVARTLNERFDALLVHGDPQVTRLEEQLAWAGEIRVPISYTGYVCGSAPGTVAPGRRIVVSAGGGAEAEALLAPCVEAWRRLEDGRSLVAFTGPFLPEEALARLQSLGDVRRFTPDLAGWIAASDLSVSRAGYNTCVDVLATRARALLVPSPLMADQRLRARRLAEMGLAESLEPEETSPGRLAQAMRRALERPRPDHAISLDGARRTRVLLEALAAGAT
jgi:predicted glycosyltransferase